MELKNTGFCLAFGLALWFAAFFGLATSKSAHAIEGDEEQKMGNKFGNYVRSIFNRTPKHNRTGGQCLGQGCLCQDSSQQPMEAIPPATQLKQVPPKGLRLPHATHHALVQQASAPQDSSAGQVLSLQSPTSFTPDNSSPAPLADSSNKVDFSDAGPSRITGSHLPGEQRTATQRALALLERLKQLETEHQSTLAYVEQLQTELQEQRKLVAKLQVSSQENQMRLQESESSRALLSKELQAMEQDFLLYQQRASRMLQTIRTELDDVFVREIVAEGQGT